MSQVRNIKHSICIKNINELTKDCNYHLSNIKECKEELSLLIRNYHNTGLNNFYKLTALEDHLGELRSIIKETSVKLHKAKKLAKYYNK
jgi:hypothetical protein